MDAQLRNAHWRDQFVLSRDERALGRQSEMAREIRLGHLVYVVRGAYRRASAITNDPQREGEDAALARVRATHLLSAEPPVFAGLSAAVVWGLPIVGNWPERVQVATATAPGGRSNVHVSRSIVGHPVPAALTDGVYVTNLARTVIDVGRTSSFETAVVVADAALRGSVHNKSPRPLRAVTVSALWSELERLDSAPGVAKCRGVLAFADASAASPGESLSRATLRKLGLPTPVLQQDFFDSQGRMTVDFWWPSARVIGEFDGKGKYLREEYSGGRSIADIVIDEKLREDRLRALGTTIVRWGWSEAASSARLLARLGNRLS